MASLLKGNALPFPQFVLTEYFLKLLLSKFLLSEIAIELFGPFLQYISVQHVSFDVSVHYVVRHSEIYSNFFVCFEHGLLLANGSEHSLYYLLPHFECGFLLHFDILLWAFLLLDHFRVLLCH